MYTIDDIEIIESGDTGTGIFLSVDFQEHGRLELDYQRNSEEYENMQHMYDNEILDFFYSDIQKKIDQINK